MLKLAEKLGIEVLTNKQLLLTIILPNLDALAAEARFTAFEWVASHWNEVETQDDLLKALASAKFVPAGLPFPHTIAPSKITFPLWYRICIPAGSSALQLLHSTSPPQCTSRQAFSRDRTCGIGQKFVSLILPLQNQRQHFLLLQEKQSSRDYTAPKISTILKTSCLQESSKRMAGCQ